MRPQQAPKMGTQQHLEPRRNLAAFWLLGLLNNSAYVVMIAGALNC